MTRTLRTIAIPITIVLTGGCSDRAAEVAREAADRQAEQNLAVIDATRDVADGSRRMLAADAESRRQLVMLHRDVQAERAQLTLQWTELELARQRLARERRRESLLVPLVQALGGSAIVTILIGYCWYALARVRNENDDAALRELLLHEVVSDQPRLFGWDATAAIRTSGSNSRLL